MINNRCIASHKSITFSQNTDSVITSMLSNIYDLIINNYSTRSVAAAATLLIASYVFYKQFLDGIKFIFAERNNDSLIFYFSNNNIIHNVCIISISIIQFRKKLNYQTEFDLVVESKSKCKISMYYRPKLKKFDVIRVKYIMSGRKKELTIKLKKIL